MIPRGDAALMEEIDDELHLVQTFKLSHFRRLAAPHLSSGGSARNLASARQWLKLTVNR